MEILDGWLTERIIGSWILDCRLATDWIMFFSGLLCVNDCQVSGIGRIIFVFQLVYDWRGGRCKMQDSGFTMQDFHAI